MPAGTELLLLQAGLLPVEAAVAAWREVAPRLGTRAALAEHAALLPLVASNLGDRTQPLLPWLVSVQRQNWYANQLMLGEVAARIARAPSPPVLRGEIAGAVHYWPNPAIRRLRQVEMVAASTGPTLPCSCRGRQARVPVPADHLLDMLLRRWWIDAACAARHPAMEWERLVAEASRRRLAATVTDRLRTLSRIVGPDARLAGVAERLGRRRPFAGVISVRSLLAGATARRPRLR